MTLPVGVMSRKLSQPVITIAASSMMMPLNIVLFIVFILF